MRITPCTKPVEPSKPVEYSWLHVKNNEGIYKPIAGGSDTIRFITLSPPSGVGNHVVLFLSKDTLGIPAGWENYNFHKMDERVCMETKPS
jgi:hypothetical protein